MMNSAFIAEPRRGRGENGREGDRGSEQIGLLYRRILAAIQRSPK